MKPKLPSNLIVSKYTSGKQYMYIDTYKEYIGYYYEFAGRKYVGREFSVNAPELIEISSPKISPLINNPSTFVYGVLSGINLPQNEVASIPYSDNLPDARVGGVPPSTQFFCKKVNDNIIKEINEKTYKSLQNNPLYITTFTGFYNNQNQNIDIADNQLPGLYSFINSENIGDAGRPI
jgi:hypothetical protein